MNENVIKPSKLYEFFLEVHQRFGKFVVLRGYDHLPNGYSNDIDVYVPEEDVKRFFQCVKTLESVTADITILDSRLGLLKCELSLEGQIVPFDVLYGFYYVGLKYQNTQTLLNNAKMHGSGLFYVPAIEDEIRISLLKELFHNNRVRSDKAKYLGLMINRCKDRLPTSFLDTQDIDLLQNAIAEGRLNLPSLCKRLKYKLLSTAISENSFDVVKNTLLFVLIK